MFNKKQVILIMGLLISNYSFGAAAADETAVLSDTEAIVNDIMDRWMSDDEKTLRKLERMSDYGKHHKFLEDHKSLSSTYELFIRRPMLDGGPYGKEWDRSNLIAAFNFALRLFKNGKFQDDKLVEKVAEKILANLRDKGINLSHARTKPWDYYVFIPAIKHLSSDDEG